MILQPAGSIDPGTGYWQRSEDTYRIEAWRSDGKLLWRHDLGWAIEKGIWYSPLITWDVNGDGKAEVIAKTGKGDPRNKDGRVHSEEEYFTIFDGETGKIIAEEHWVSRQGMGYNLGSRNFLGIAYLDGKTPFIIVQKGTYSVIRVEAWQLVGNKLERKMKWSNDFGPFDTWGCGAHRLHAADIDNDGREELCVGSFALDDNGTVLWSLGLGHPDFLYVGDLNPDVTVHGNFGKRFQV